MLLNLPPPNEREFAAVESAARAWLGERGVQAVDMDVIVPAAMSVFRSMDTLVVQNVSPGSRALLDELMPRFRANSSLWFFNLLGAYAVLRLNGLPLEIQPRRPGLRLVDPSAGPVAGNNTTDR